MARVRVHGKQFDLSGERFPFRGVTYGTFAAREDGALLPDREVMKQDFALMRERGFTVVRTYTEPPEDLRDLAADWGLRVLAGVFYPDWRYLVGTGRRDFLRIARQARRTVRAAARRLAHDERVLGLVLGNEIPADVIRWVGTRKVARVLDSLVEICREEAPDLPVTYANYPTAEYLPLDQLDFLTFNVFLERDTDFRRYLNRLHNLAGERPLVLGEIGLDSGGHPAGEQAQAELLDWQLEIATERGIAGTCVFSWTDEWVVGGTPVEGWHFGLTRADRSPRPALDVAEAWNHRTVRDLDHPWPKLSVVICAYNAEPYIDECLRHTCALDYPDLEVVVVDDGSTDRTVEIARRHPRARVVEVEHGGLSLARNEGFRAATGDLVAYLDSDAFPSPEWPYYLALGLHSRLVAGVGGPNVPPPDDPPGAHVVARAPGGPVHVLMGDDRAEHVPGCNMAFWRYALEEVGGFDPIYTAAGDDVDLCWKILDRDWEIGFHPAALVWHRRRPTVRTYLKQQCGYGRAEALVEARHPDRFNAIGTARWRGRIYNSFAPKHFRQRVYRGAFGAAAYQSVYQGGGHAMDIVHQVGVPAAVLLVAAAPLALLLSGSVLPLLLDMAFLGALFTVGLVQTRAPRDWSGSRLDFRARVAFLHLAQPVVRLWGRLRPPRQKVRPGEIGLPLGPLHRTGPMATLLPAGPARPEVAALVVARLRQAGIKVVLGTGWEDYDARLLGSSLVRGDLVTSGFPEGYLQIRLRLRLRSGRFVAAAAAVALLALGSLALGVLAGLLLAVEALRGLWRAMVVPRRVLRTTTAGSAHG